MVYWGEMVYWAELVLMLEYQTQMTSVMIETYHSLLQKIDLSARKHAFYASVFSCQRENQMVRLQKHTAHITQLVSV